MNCPDEWQRAVRAALRWRDDPELAGQLRTAIARLRQPVAPAPRSALTILIQEEASARLGWECAADSDRAVAYAQMKKWQPGLFGYSETQRSAAGRLAAEEALRAAQDNEEREAATAVIDRFRTCQSRVRNAIGSFGPVEQVARVISRQDQTAFGE